MDKTLVTERHQRLIALIIEAREKSGMTQTDLADALGEYQSFDARLESGQRRLNVIEFIRLAEVLDFDLTEMISKVSTS